MNLKEYLITQKKFSINTAEEYERFIEKRFKEYLERISLSIENFQYEELLQYIKERQSQNIKPKTINQEIKKIGYYLEYHKLKNITENIRIKGITKNLPHDIFSQQELDKIYENFPKSKNYWTHEKTLKIYHIIIGLKIYQGITEQELEKLEITDINLKNGKIYIPSTRRTNSRILDLKPFQIMPLYEYINTTREEIKEEIEGKRLFHTKRLRRGIPRIREMIRRYEPRLKTIHQIRASVITEWLKVYNLREVQYMAGHRYVSSTERYRTDSIENLQKKIEKYHPLNYEK